MTEYVDAHCPPFRPSLDQPPLGRDAAEIERFGQDIAKEADTEETSEPFEEIAFFDQVGSSELLNYFDYFRFDDAPEKLQQVIPWANWASHESDVGCVWVGDLRAMRRAGALISAFYDPVAGIHTLELSLGFDTFLGLLQAMRTLVANCDRLADEPTDFIGWPISVSTEVDRVVIEDSWWRSKSGRYQVVGDFRADLVRYDGSPTKTGCCLTVRKFLQ